MTSWHRDILPTTKLCSTDFTSLSVCILMKKTQVEDSNANPFSLQLVLFLFVFNFLLLTCVFNWQINIFYSLAEIYSIIHFAIICNTIYHLNALIHIQLSINKFSYGKHRGHKSESWIFTQSYVVLQYISYNQWFSECSSFS